MYSGQTTRTKARPPTGAYLARPRLGTVKGIYSSRPLSSKSPLYSTDKRKMKYRKTLSAPKMDYRRRTDPVDTAYREAVGRLKILLAESYTAGKRPLRDDSGDDTDNQSLLSSRSRHSHHHRTSPFIGRRYPYYPAPLKTLHNTYGTLNSHHGTTTDPEKSARKDPPEKWEEKPPNPEMMGFIERQEDYIEQLEREAQFCREELSGLLGKVKDVITENENLHEKQKSHLIKSVFDHLETETETENELEVRTPKKSPRKKRLEGPSIVFESRISELEAQLTQTKIELRKCQEDNDNYKRKIADGTIGDLSAFETYKLQIENLQRDKAMLQDSMSKIQLELAQLREKNSDTSHKIKRSLDVVEQAHFEKNQLESEIRRLKDELERQHDKIRDSVHDQTRRIADERAAVERRYSQQIEQLTSELGVQWETTSKLQLELDKQRREDTDVRRDIIQKQAQIDELKKEMQSKTAILQSDLTASAAERSALEQQIATLNLANERADRQAKQDSARLQAEIQSLRQRLDRADADLLHSRRENLRLSDQIASLEKELNMSALLSEDRTKKAMDSSRSVDAIPALPPPSASKEHELTSMIKDMENKHVSTVAELEGMIHSQNQLMEKLTSECHLLTQKLEDSSNRHKGEIRELQTNLDYLSNRLNQQSNYIQPSPKDEQHIVDNNPRTSPHNTNTARQRTRPIESPRTTPVNNASLSRTDSVASMKNTSPINPTTTSPPKPTETAIRKPLTDTAQKNISPKHVQPQYEQSQEVEYKQPIRQTKPEAVQQIKQEYEQTQPNDQYQQQTKQDMQYEQPESYPDQQYAQDYVDPQQYTQERDYTEPQTDYDQPEQYETQPEYTTDQQYLPDQQYVGDDQQYGADYQYPDGQQYAPDQQYTEGQEYPMDQQYTDQQPYQPEYQGEEIKQQEYSEQQYVEPMQERPIEQAPTFADDQVKSGEKEQVAKEQYESEQK